MADRGLIYQALPSPEGSATREKILNVETWHAVPLPEIGVHQLVNALKKQEQALALLRNNE